MYTILRSKNFEKSYKRLKGSVITPSIKTKLEHLVADLATGKKLPPSTKDHKLSGELKDYRECHIKPDLLLGYQIRDKELILLLIDIGSHAYLFN